MSKLNCEKEKHKAVKKKKLNTFALAIAAPFVMTGIILGCIHLLQTPTHSPIPAPIADLALLAEMPQSFVDSTITIQGLFVEQQNLGFAIGYTLCLHQHHKRYVATILTERLPHIEIGSVVHATVVVRRVGKSKYVLIEKE